MNSRWCSRQYYRPPKRFGLFQQNLPSGKLILAPQWAQLSFLAGGSVDVLAAPAFGGVATAWGSAVGKAPASITRDSLLSHLGGPQPQRHLRVRWVVFTTAQEIGQGLALEHVQWHQA